MIKHPHTVTFTLNGELKTFITRPDEKLLDLLRREGYKGTKYGCGQGTCGALHRPDGRPAIYSCLLFAMQAEEPRRPHHRKHRHPRQSPPSSSR
jgi:aerobic-type carbon monoxide dehydrogenase small subunit (CoxS/CutS family)